MDNLTCKNTVTIIRYATQFLNQKVLFNQKYLPMIHSADKVWMVFWKGGGRGSTKPPADLPCSKYTHPKMWVFLPSSRLLSKLIDYMTKVPLANAASSIFRLCQLSIKRNSLYAEPVWDTIYAMSQYRVVHANQLHRAHS